MARMTGTGHDAVRGWLWKGEEVRAAWAAAKMLQSEPSDLHALELCGCALVALGRRDEGVAALRACADAAADGGDLPLALACMFALSEAGEQVNELLDAIVAGYHRDSPRVDPRRRLAPPLPRELPEVPSAVDREEAIRLAVAAVKTASDRLTFERSMAMDKPLLPAIPLLGTLSVESLRAVLTGGEAVRIDPGGLLVEQGTEGDALYLVLCGWARVVRRSRAGDEQILRRLAPGSVVGEVALVTRAPRVASVRSDTGLMALRLSRAVVEELSEREATLADELVEFCRQKMVSNLLETSPLFSGLDEAGRESVLRSFDRRVVPGGEVVVTQGAPSPGLFLIVAGKAEVLQQGGDGGEWTRLAELGPADVFGEMSLVLEGPATATVRIVYDSALLLLPRERFLRVVEAYPELLAELRRLARDREEETRSLLGQPSIAADDLTLV